MVIIMAKKRFASIGKYTIEAGRTISLKHPERYGLHPNTKKVRIFKVKEKGIGAWHKFYAPASYSPKEALRWYKKQSKNFYSYKGKKLPKDWEDKLIIRFDDARDEYRVYCCGKKLDSFPAREIAYLFGYDDDYSLRTHPDYIYIAKGRRHIDTIDVYDFITDYIYKHLKKRA